MLKELFSIGLTTKVDNNGPLKDLKFEFTGSLSKPRKEIVTWIEKNGGHQASISNADYLICNSVSSTPKYTRAKKNNIPIITEEELVKLYLQLNKEMNKI
jgi:NAD-dependent DNA ligase